MMSCSGRVPGLASTTSVLWGSCFRMTAKNSWLGVDGGAGGFAFELPASTMMGQKRSVSVRVINRLRRCGSMGAGSSIPCSGSCLGRPPPGDRRVAWASAVWAVSAPGLRLLALLTVILDGLLQLLPQVFEVELDAFHDGIGLNGRLRQQVGPEPSCGLKHRLRAEGGLLLEIGGDRLSQMLCEGLHLLLEVLLVVFHERSSSTASIPADQSARARGSPAPPGWGRRPAPWPALRCARAARA